MTKNHIIKAITLNDCLPLRHKVLWPLLTVQECIDKEDENSSHFGYFMDDHVISCLSVFPHSPLHCQIRKFATHPSFQKQGIGSKLFTTVLTHYKKSGTELVSLNARESAVGFYEKFNFHVSGEPFVKKNVSFIPMQIALKDCIALD